MPFTSHKVKSQTAILYGLVAVPSLDEIVIFDTKDIEGRKQLLTDGVAESK